MNGRSAFRGGRPSFRTYPSKGQKARFHVAFGGGARYVPKHERIWATVAARRPLAFLFLGDNIYTDCPERRDVQRVYYYRRQLNSEYRRMCASSAERTRVARTGRTSQLTTTDRAYCGIPAGPVVSPAFQGIEMATHPEGKLNVVQCHDRTAACSRPCCTGFRRFQVRRSHNDVWSIAYFPCFRSPRPSDHERGHEDLNSGPNPRYYMMIDGPCCPRAAGGLVRS